jgi:hypothetical protein
MPLRGGDPNVEKEISKASKPQRQETPLSPWCVEVSMNWKCIQTNILYGITKFSVCMHRWVCTCVCMSACVCMHVREKSSVFSHSVLFWPSDCICTSSCRAGPGIWTPWPPLGQCPCFTNYWETYHVQIMWKRVLCSYKGS